MGLCERIMGPCQQHAGISLTQKQYAILRACAVPLVLPLTQRLYLVGDILTVLPCPGFMPVFVSQLVVDDPVISRRART